MSTAPITHQNRLAVVWGGPPSACQANVADCLIVGLGNCLLRDDGVGVHAVRALLDDPPADALVLEVGTDVFSAVPWLEAVSRVLIIDAMDAGSPAGSLYRCGARDIAVAPLRASLHELGLLSILEFIAQADRPEITVLGVQPALIEYGLELSPPLQASLPRVVQAAQDIVGAWNPGREHRSCPRGVSRSALA